jgi:hypothetical protein
VTTGPEVQAIYDGTDTAVSSVLGEVSSSPDGREAEDSCAASAFLFGSYTCSTNEAVPYAIESAADFGAAGPVDTALSDAVNGAQLVVVDIVKDFRIPSRDAFALAVPPPVKLDGWCFAASGGRTNAQRWIAAFAIDAKTTFQAIAIALAVWKVMVRIEACITASPPVRSTGARESSSAMAVVAGIACAVWHLQSHTSQACDLHQYPDNRRCDPQELFRAALASLTKRCVEGSCAVAVWQHCYV